MEYDLLNIHLTTSDCHAVSKVLQQHQIMKIVELQNCTMGDAGLVELLPGLKACRQLDWLSLGQNNLTSVNMSDIAEIIRSNKQHLTAMGIHGNKGFNSEAIIIPWSCPSNML